MQNRILSKKLILMICFCSLFLGISTTKAQMSTTKIKDGTVSGSSTTAVTGALLELESTSKGFLTPRLTNSQRDAIPLANRVDGLLIYNKTTGCFNYWNTAQVVWMSICGTPPPAVINVSGLQCKSVTVNGRYKQGEYLNSNNSLSIPITVTQAGTYDITARSSNGYYFFKSGTFPNTGTYMLNLEGVGTPRSGNSSTEAGDEISIIINGTPNSCKPVVSVENANVDYNIACAAIKAVGNYFIGQRLDESHLLKIQVNVINTGFWSIETNTVNGYSFGGTGMFGETGPQEIELTSNGAPIQSGTDIFTLNTNAESPINCTNIPIEVEAVKYSINCLDAVVEGNYRQDVAMNDKNTMVLAVDVEATGQTIIKTNTVSGISFSSGPVTLDQIGIQKVVLKASGTPIENGDFELTVASDPVMSCKVKVAIEAQPVSYTTSCSSIQLKGLYAPETAMTENNTMSVDVNVEYLGNYSISTNSLNGITFSSSGVFAKTGQQKLVLKATGTPVSGGTYSYTLNSNSNNIGCTKNIKFLYRKIKVLGMGSGLYQPASASNNETARSVLMSKANFGPNGTVKVRDIVIINGSTSQGNSLKALINKNDIDIIVIGYGFKPNSKSNSVLMDFVKTKKGVLIHAQESDDQGVKDLINNITNSNSLKISKAGATYFNPFTTETDPVLEGPFKNLKGKGMGSDVNNSYYLTDFPASMKNLANRNKDSYRSCLLKHSTLGYVYIGDAGWIAGNSSNHSATIYPAAISTTGLPISKDYTGGNAYNSVIYANIMAWAIKYVQENTLSNYQIP